VLAPGLAQCPRRSGQSADAARAHHAAICDGARHPAQRRRRGAARDVRRRSRQRHPLCQRQRSERRPQHRRRAAHTRRAADRRALSLQLAKGAGHDQGGVTMSAVEILRDSISEPARDIKLNLQNVLQAESLTAAQRWGVAIASAVAARTPRLRDALIDDARAAGVDEAVIDDALAAASLMAMNNVFYRFRHMVAKESYTQKP